MGFFWFYFISYHKCRHIRVFITLNAIHFLSKEEKENEHIAISRVSFMYILSFGAEN